MKTAHRDDVALTIRMPRQTADDLRKAAADRYRSQSAQVAKIIEEWLRREEAADAPTPQ